MERAYRDSRINRIFEGTNEINRLLVTGMLLKRAQRGQLALVEAVKAMQKELLASPSASVVDEEAVVSNSKRSVLLLLGAAYERYGAALGEQQEILAAIADVTMQSFALESAYLRARKSGSEMARLITTVHAHDCLVAIESAGQVALAACSEGDTLRTQLAVLRRFTKRAPVNTIGLRTNIAELLTRARRYGV